MVVAGKLELTVEVKINKGQLSKEIEKAAKLFQKKLGSISMAPGIKAGGGSGKSQDYLAGMLKVLTAIHKKMDITAKENIVETSDESKKTMRLFKIDLIWRWVKGIWNNTQKYMPLMAAIEKLNTSLIKMFLYPITLRIFKVLLPIYLWLITLAKWWMSGGFTKIMEGIFGKGGKTIDTSTLAKTVVAIFDISGLEKALGKLVEGSGKIVSDFLGKWGSKLSGFLEASGLKEVWSIFKDKLTEKFGPLYTYLGTLGEKLGKFVLEKLPFLGTILGKLGEWLGEKGLSGVLGKAVGVIVKWFNPALWGSIVGDLLSFISYSLLDWIDSPFWRKILVVLGNLGDVMSPLLDVIGWVVDAWRDLFDAITTGKVTFTHLFARFEEIGRAFNILSGTLGGILGFGGGKADGGSVSPSKSYMVGERGPEMFTPGTSGNITPNNKMGGNVGNITVNISTQKIDQTNLDYIAKQVGDKIYSDLRRRATF